MMLSGGRPCIPIASRFCTSFHTNVRSGAMWSSALLERWSQLMIAAAVGMPSPRAAFNCSMADERENVSDVSMRASGARPSIHERIDALVDRGSCSRRPHTHVADVLTLVGHRAVESRAWARHPNCGRDHELGPSLQQ